MFSTRRAIKLEKNGQVQAKFTYQGIRTKYWHIINKFYKNMCHRSIQTAIWLRKLGDCLRSLNKDYNFL